MTGPNHLHMESGVSAFDGSPFVVLAWGEQRGQLTPPEAIEHAVAMIEVATAARHDSVVVAALRRIGFSMDEAAAFLAGLRTMRQAEGDEQT